MCGVRMDKQRVIKVIESSITGALHGGEGERLYDLAKRCKGRGVIVEIGSLLGKSTAYLGFGSKAGRNVKVYAIDPFDGGDLRPHSGFVKDLIGKGSFFDKFMANMRKARLLDIVVPIPKHSKEAVDDVKEPIELLFIDGAHDYEFVKMDILNYLPKVLTGGTVAFHDRNWPGVKRAIKELILAPKKLDNIKTFKSILYGRKR